MSCDAAAVSGVAELHERARDGCDLIRTRPEMYVRRGLAVWENRTDSTSEHLLWQQESVTAKSAIGEGAVLWATLQLVLDGEDFNEADQNCRVTYV
jgi:hypothetical protein